MSPEEIEALEELARTGGIVRPGRSSSNVGAATGSGGVLPNRGRSESNIGAATGSGGVLPNRGRSESNIGAAVGSGVVPPVPSGVQLGPVGTLDEDIASLLYEEQQIILAEALEKYERDRAAIEASYASDMASLGADTSAIDEERSRIAANLAAYNEILGRSAAGAGSRIDAMVGAGVGEDVMAELAAIYAADSVGIDYLNGIGDRLALGAMGIGTGPVSGDAAAIAGQLGRIGELERREVEDVELSRDATLAALADVARGMEGSRGREARNSVVDRQRELDRMRQQEIDRAYRDQLAARASYDSEIADLGAAPTIEELRREQGEEQSKADLTARIALLNKLDAERQVLNSLESESAKQAEAKEFLASLSSGEISDLQREFGLPPSDTPGVDVVSRVFGIRL